MQVSAIETLADILTRQQVHEGIEVGDTLVPEQCMLIYIDGKEFHVTIQPTESQEAVDHYAQEVERVGY